MQEKLDIPDRKLCAPSLRLFVILYERYNMAKIVVPKFNLKIQSRIFYNSLLFWVFFGGVFEVMQTTLFLINYNIHV